MNAPFQSVGIIFFVTIVHVVAIAVYSSRSLPESTFQRSIVIPDVDSLEVMPEQLVRDLSASKGDEVTKKEEAVKSGKSVPVRKKDTQADGPVKAAKAEVPERKLEFTPPEKVVIVKAASPKKVSQEVVAAEVFKEIPAGRWEDNEFADRIQYPVLDGILGKKSKKLAENKPSTVPKADDKSPARAPAPRSRSFSPIPRS